MWYLLPDPSTPKFTGSSSTLMDIATKLILQNSFTILLPRKTIYWSQFGENKHQSHTSNFLANLPPDHVLNWATCTARLEISLAIVLVGEEHCLPSCSFPKVLVQYIFLLVSLVHTLLVQSMPSSHLGCAAKSRFSSLSTKRLVPGHSRTDIYRRFLQMQIPW